MKTSKYKRTAKSPTLRFSPYAWAKLIFLRDLGETEVGGFGICRGENLLHVDDVQMVKQTCTAVTVEFDDESVADFFDRQTDAGLHPANFARIWIHTHPGDSARPSSTDEATFARVFGGSDWACMFILAQGGQTYARLQFNVGPGGSIELPVEVDYSRPFAASDWDAWEQEYHANVDARSYFALSQASFYNGGRGNTDTPDKHFDVGYGYTNTPDEYRDAWHGYSDDDFKEISEYEQF